MEPGIIPNLAENGEAVHLGVGEIENFYILKLVFEDLDDLVLVLIEDRGELSSKRAHSRPMMRLSFSSLETMWDFSHIRAAPL